MAFKAKKDKTSFSEIDFVNEPSPSKIRKSRIFKKYFSYLVVLILITTSAAGTIMMIIVNNRYKKQELDNLHDTAASIAGLSSDLINASDGGEYITDYENALSLTCYATKVFSENSDSDIFITNSDGKILVCKHLLELYNDLVKDNVCEIHSKMKISERDMQEIKDGEKNSYIGSLTNDKKEHNLIAAAPIKMNNKEHTLLGYVFVTKDNDSAITTALTTIRLQFLLSVIFSVAISFYLIYKLIYGFVQPLQSILYATRRYANGDFSYRITEDAVFGEMKELTTAFNSMANDLSSLENSRRNFVANVSHELKTPMTTIGGFIDGILDGTIPPSQQKKYLRTVSDEVKRLARLVSSMLNMSRIEAGELTPSYTKFNLSEMIIKTFLGFEQIISNNKINVTGLDTLENLSVSADPDMINQVIYNIIDNAVKFTPSGGNISVSCKKEFGNATVRVRNYGVGVANEELKLLFDRFYKTDKSRSLNTKSVGLGLYICKNIIELHKGKIYATSKENEYTEFTVELPIVRN